MAMELTFGAMVVATQDHGTIMICMVLESSTGLTGGSTKGLMLIASGKGKGYLRGQMGASMTAGGLAANSMVKG